MYMSEGEEVIMWIVQVTGPSGMLHDQDYYCDTVEMKDVVVARYESRGNSVVAWFEASAAGRQPDYSMSNLK
jgi:hypothetical protein